MGYRVEKDFLGEKRVPDDAYYGVQTLRGLENFHITGIPMSREPYFVKAFGYVKKAAAMANRDLRVLDARIADAIIRACDRGDRGRHERPVRDGLHPGGRGHLDQHERQRGDRQPGPREPGSQEGRIPVRQSQRPRELRAIHERRLPDGVPPGPDPAPRELHGSAAPAAGGLPRQESRVRPRPQDGSHSTPSSARGDHSPESSCPNSSAGLAVRVTCQDRYLDHRFFSGHNRSVSLPSCPCVACRPPGGTRGMGTEGPAVRTTMRSPSSA